MSDMEIKVEVGYAYLKNFEDFCKDVNGRRDAATGEVFSRESGELLFSKRLIDPLMKAQRFADEDGRCLCFVDAAGPTVATMRLISIDDPTYYTVPVEAFVPTKK